jgi:hypothetical protein
VSEAANQRLRLEASLIAIARSDKGRAPDDGGVAISIIVSEVEAVGGFVGASFSEPVLNGGILLSVFGYMVFMQPWMALVAFALFCPQILFIPLLQEAINRAPSCGSKPCARCRSTSSTPRPIRRTRARRPTGPRRRRVSG